VTVGRHAFIADPVTVVETVSKLYLLRRCRLPAEASAKGESCTLPLQGFFKPFLGFQHQGLGIIFNKEYTPPRFNGKPGDGKEEVQGALQELIKRDILQ